MIISIFRLRDLFLCQKVIKVFFLHACKIADFTGTHLNYGFFCYFCYYWFLRCVLFVLNMWACHCYPLQFQDVSNILDFSWKTWMCIEDWNFDPATNFPIPSNQQMFHASCFYCYLLVTGVWWKEILFSFIVIGILYYCI